jgi:hypothetical protein
MKTVLDKEADTLDHRSIDIFRNKRKDALLGKDEENFEDAMIMTRLETAVGLGRASAQ